MKNLEIIQADYSDPAHSTALIMLLDEYARDPMGGGQGLSEQVKSDLIDTLADTPGAFSVLAFVDQKPTGLVNCFQSLSTFKCKPLINIHDVIVSGSFRGHNISQGMLEAVEAIARQRGCCKLTLEVLDGNEPAKNAYIKFGFSGYELDPRQGKALFWEKEL